MWSRIRKENDGAGLATDLQDAWGEDEARQGALCSEAQGGIVA